MHVCIKNQLAVHLKLTQYCESTIHHFFKKHLLGGPRKNLIKSQKSRHATYNFKKFRNQKTKLGNKTNHKTALELLKQEGAKIITLEIALFEFLKSSKHPNFKEIQALIK